MKKKAKGDLVARARERVWTAMARAKYRYGGARWMSGYRVGLLHRSDHAPADAPLMRREHAHLDATEQAERALTRALRAYAAAIRQAKKRQA